MITPGTKPPGSCGQFNGFLTLPDGSAATSLGAVAFMDTTINEAVIDNQPFAPELAVFFPDETSYAVSLSGL